MCICRKKRCGCCIHKKCTCYQKQCGNCNHRAYKCNIEQEINEKVDVPQEAKKTAELVCHNLSGNLLLNDHVPDLQIWKERIKGKTIVSITVYNSTLSIGSIRVLINRNNSPIEFMVPPGNTLSETIDYVDSIAVFQTNEGRTEGKYCLNVCFLFF
ncbi:S-Ena type endospore appendage [Bacillus sp. JJ722]|uniref:S-Ena type endospore appendage n=1 Tax=Bacillus sp. JJ722 TaxID=3122973 RepID=UPI002FFEEEB6